MKKIAILQSNYIPWKGYFDIIKSVDEFIIYDDVQYTKRDWRNRNLIKTANGIRWLTIPVQVKNKYSQKICETKVSDNYWVNKHIKTIKSNYSKASNYNEVNDWIIAIFNQCQKLNYLSDINLLFIGEILSFLNIKTKISLSNCYLIEGNKSEKILNICLQAGASEYVTGSAAKTYLDLDSFNRNGIKIAWMDYSNNNEYLQLYPPFVHKVSIIDLIYNTGSNANKYLIQESKDL